MIELTVEKQYSVNKRSVSVSLTMYLKKKLNVPGEFTAVGDNYMLMAYTILHSEGVPLNIFFPREKTFQDFNKYTNKQIKEQ